MAHGSYSKKSNGKYEVCFEFGYDASRKRISKFKTYDKKVAILLLKWYNIKMIS